MMVFLPWLFFPPDFLDLLDLLDFLDDSFASSFVLLAVVEERMLGRETL